MEHTRRIIVLGSTGSIGTATLEVVTHLASLGGPAYRVVGLAAGTNASLVAQQAAEHGVRHVAVADEQAARALPAGVTAFSGPDAAIRLVNEVARPGDLVMGAIVGAAGIAPTLAAIERGCHVALANKETLVAAGAVVREAVARMRIELLPVDSEHSAVFQCMRAGTPREVQRLVLTASGGPFRTWSAERTRNATLSEALRHPTWQMGRKVTIDSASLMNKALEVIEARWLFDLRADQIEVVVHPQSIVHSFVEFVDGSVVAQLSPPDMKLPIQYALTWPERVAGLSPKLDWRKAFQLDFHPPDLETFPALALGFEVARRGGTCGAVLNAANEQAVALFLEGRIRFRDIATACRAVLDAHDYEPQPQLATLWRLDAWARHEVTRWVC